LTGEGLEELRRAIIDKLGLLNEPSDCPVVSLRQVTELKQALRSSLLASDELKAGPEHVVIAANQLRSAAEALGRIVGRVYSDDLLDVIFGHFCVGK